MDSVRVRDAKGVDTSTPTLQQRKQGSNRFKALPVDDQIEDVVDRESPHEDGSGLPDGDTTDSNSEGYSGSKDSSDSGSEPEVSKCCYDSIHISISRMLLSPKATFQERRGQKLLNLSTSVR